MQLRLEKQTYSGPYRATLERAREDLANAHAEGGNSRKKKAKLVELLKSAGNGLRRRGGRKPFPCGGVDAEEEVPADGVTSCTQEQAPREAWAMQVSVPEVDSSMEEEVPAVDVFMALQPPTHCCISRELQTCR